MKFLKNITEFINESESKEPKYKFGCMMLFFDFPEIEEIHASIEEDDIDKEEGYETDSHITLLYGLHADEIADNDLFGAIEDFEYKNVTLHNVSIFENEKYDVLKFDVKSEDDYLHKVNKKLTEFPFTTDYPDYHPHCTIAYLKSGKGQKYVDQLKDKEYEAIPTKLVYSKPYNDGEEKLEVVRDIEKDVE